MITESKDAIKMLIVEDSLTEQMHMQKLFTKLGYQVETAENGKQALEIIVRNKIQLVITNWRMPELSGIELCRLLREDVNYGQPYIILVTGCDAKADLVAAMDAGADDYISKPFNGEELRVRLQAGVRIVQLRIEAEQRNSLLSEALTREAVTSELIKKDLEAAAMMQQVQLPESISPFPSLEVDSLFIPASTVAGDNFNFFKVDDKHLIFYHLDVAGHGIASAMLSFTVAHFMSPGMGIIPLPNKQLVLKDDEEKIPLFIRRPDQVIEALNRRFVDAGQYMHYFTMIYGLLNVETGEGTLCQAGHPHPLIIDTQGNIRKLGDGGFPVGMLSDSSYENTPFTLAQGERLFLYSDGITDCRNHEETPLAIDRFSSMLKLANNKSLPETIKFIDANLKLWHNHEQLEDDVSLLVIARGYDQPQHGE